MHDHRMFFKSLHVVIQDEVKRLPKISSQVYEPGVMVSTHQAFKVAVMHKESWARQSQQSSSQIMRLEAGPVREGLGQVAVVLVAPLPNTKGPHSSDSRRMERKGHSPLHLGALVGSWVVPVAVGCSHLLAVHMGPAVVVSSGHYTDHHVDLHHLLPGDSSPPAARLVGYV